MPIPSKASPVSHSRRATSTGAGQLAAVAVEVEGGPGQVEARAVDVAGNVVSLLRFYSNAAYTPWLLCPCAVLGSEVVPRTMTLALGPSDEFRTSEKPVVPHVLPWRLSAAELNAMRQSGLDQLSKLVDEDGLSDFRRRLRTSLLAYSKGTTLPDVSDRLVYTLSALAGLFLKDSSEPIQQNLGERMAFPIEREAESRQKVVQNVRAAYGMRSKYIHHRITVLEEESLELFVANARKVLYISLMSADHFNSQADFVAAIDRIKFGE